MKRLLYGAVEAGGTKFICSVADEQGQTLAETRIATTTPAATLAAVLQFFGEQQTGGSGYAGMGVASFGPIELKRHSHDFGCLMSTPKAGWSHTNLVKPLADRFDCPVAIDTDVNSAALAEALHGAGRGCDCVVYITVGTGIGGGISIQGNPLQGSLHPEMGHIPVVKHAHDRNFAGICPFHGDCLEGLASGPAITARFGTTLDQLPADHVAIDIIAHYLGQLAAINLLFLSPQRLIFGGGVMDNPGLLQQVHRKASSLLKGYAGHGASPEALGGIIVAPGLQQRSGIMGALELARSAATGARYP